MTLRARDSANQPLPYDSGKGYSALRSREFRTISIGAIALGALALGALAIGAVAIGRLAIGRARIRRLEIDELVVRKLRVIDEIQAPTRLDPET